MKEPIEVDDVENDALGRGVRIRVGRDELDKILAQLSLSLESVNACHKKSSSSSSIGATTSPKTADLQFNFKLPTLDFLVFKGDPVDWATLRDQFKTSINSNSRLDLTLKKYLDGQALSAISGLRKL